MKIQGLDVSVALLAGASCLLMVIQVPVWAVFIGWAWYFTLGAKPELIKKGILPSIAGSVLACVAFPLIGALSAVMPPLAATIISVIITVFLLMLTLKVPILNFSLMSFNAYSCIFVGYAAGTYLVIDGMPALLNAGVWITGGNILGLIFGWLSILFSTSRKQKADEERSA
ncbi:MAG: DUF1097 domain-containing protein [Clostridiales Family XIII bacterium]|jgi:hypothetical protein|nr:DUF1097 domain-containing protein [Clostridiales Family XIII bacterium]